jgi:hypothetical protein
MTSKNEFNSGYNNTLFIRDWSLKKRGVDVIYDSNKLEFAGVHNRATSACNT